MTGDYYFNISTNNVDYVFNIKRNITVITGYSGTGKTTLIDILESYLSSISNDILPEVVIDTNAKWDIINSYDLSKLPLFDTNDVIYFMDEKYSRLFNNGNFINCMKNSGNYFVVITRKNNKSFPIMPYSFKEIYGIETRMVDNRYINTFKSIYPLYKPIIRPDVLIIEDSKSGFDFFSQVADKYNFICKTSYGNSNIFTVLNEYIESNYIGNILIIADGSAFGSYIKKIYELYRKYDNIYLWLPESFEYLLLCSGMFRNNTTLQEILKSPINYIDCSKYISWERFFTKLLVYITKECPNEYNEKKNNSTAADENYRFNYVNKFREQSTNGICINTCYIENCCHKDCKDCQMFFCGDKIDDILGDKADIFKNNELKVPKLNLF